MIVSLGRWFCSRVLRRCGFCARVQWLLRSPNGFAGRALLLGLWHLMWMVLLWATLVRLELVALSGMSPTFGALVLLLMLAFLRFSKRSCWLCCLASVCAGSVVCAALWSGGILSWPCTWC